MCCIRDDDFPLATSGFEPPAGRLIAVLRKDGFNADQPRDDQGRWTDAGHGSDGQVILTGGSGYPVDILKEDAFGGHTLERHVGKPEEYLKARILGSRTNIAGILSFGEVRAGPMNED